LLWFAWTKIMRSSAIERLTAYLEVIGLQQGSCAAATTLLKTMMEIPANYFG
jgi:hypothetical protein